MAFRISLCVLYVVIGFLLYGMACMVAEDSEESDLHPDAKRDLQTGKKVLLIISFSFFAAGSYPLVTH